MPRAILSKAGAWCWSALAVSLALTGCTRSEPSRAPRSDQLTDHVRVFLISPGDAGRAGRKVACDDSAVAVDLGIGTKQPGLEGALAALLALKGHYHLSSGLYNALYSSRLELVRVERQPEHVRVDLRGYLELGDDCDNRRLLAELTETARQFSDVGAVQFFLDDRDLAEILTPASPP